MAPEQAGEMMNGYPTDHHIDELNQRIDHLDVTGEHEPQPPTDNSAGSDPFAQVQEGDFSHVKPAVPLAIDVDRSSRDGAITAALLVGDYATGGMYYLMLCNFVKREWSNR